MNAAVTMDLAPAWVVRVKLIRSQSPAFFFYPFSIITAFKTELLVTLINHVRSRIYIRP